MKNRILFLSLFLLLSAGVPAFADSLSFDVINDNGCDDLSGQLAVDVAPYGTDQVLFTFTNNGEIASVIAAVYFDDTNGLLTNVGLIDKDDVGIYGEYGSAGVDFSMGGNPSDLPSGGNAGFFSDSTQTADSPAPKNGINNNAGEWLGVYFDVASFEGVVNALNIGDLRIGLHVTGIAPNGGSESYVNHVPEPTTIILLGTALIGLAAIGRRRVR